MRMKFTTPAAIALAALFSFSSFGATTAQAGHNNWFYNNYERYQDQADYGDEYYDEETDEYVVYAPPPRFQRNRYQRNRYQRRQDRLRRWAKRQNRKALRRANRPGRAGRPGRQRLYDAWQEGPYVQPRRKKAKKHAESKRRKLAAVPLPRAKPYNLMPSQIQAPTQAQAPALLKPDPVKKFTLETLSGPDKFDQRPTLRAAPSKNLTIAEKPMVKKVKTESTRQKASAPFRPIRIELVKNPGSDELRQPRKPAKTPTKMLASNQLSCAKAKSIVSDYGFSGITARTCTGTVYDFTAKRDGKPYSVKVSSLSGELKGVKKIK